MTFLAVAFLIYLTVVCLKIPIILRFSKMADMAILSNDKHAKNLTRHLTKKLIFRTLLWPFFFLVDKSPFERLAQTLFKRYGDKGCVYYGYAGFKNFCNDIFHGKNRYANWISIRREMSCDTVFADLPCKSVIVAVAHHKATDKLKCAFFLEKNRSNIADRKLSRYELDDCSFTTLPELTKHLEKINADMAEFNRLLITLEVTQPRHIQI